MEDIEFNIHLLFLKGLQNADGTPRYSVYTVNLIPLGGYTISIFACTT